MSPALHPPEQPSHTHTPNPDFGGRGHEFYLHVVVSYHIVRGEWLPAAAAAYDFHCPYSYSKPNHNHLEDKQQCCYGWRYALWQRLGSKRGSLTTQHRASGNRYPVYLNSETFLANEEYLCPAQRCASGVLSTWPFQNALGTGVVKASFASNGAIASPGRKGSYNRRRARLSLRKSGKTYPLGMSHPAVASVSGTIVRCKLGRLSIIVHNTQSNVGGFAANKGLSTEN